jgi:16S rRNA U516 pseudouridylate synthase RsuA-like enzyme
VFGRDAAQSFTSADAAIAAISIAVKNAVRRQSGNNIVKPTVSIKKASKENSTIAIVNKPSGIVNETA